MMAPINMERIFDKAVAVDENTILAVVEAPEREEDLLKLMERAMLRGFDNHTRLTQIQLPMARFPFMDSKFWHVPIEDCGAAQVLRVHDVEATRDAVTVFSVLG